MNPSAKGWLKQFELYYKQHLLLDAPNQNPDELIYEL
jgi:hypothetical protein